MRWSDEQYQLYLARKRSLAPQDHHCPEAVLMAHVLGALRQRGFKAYHTKDSRGSDPGFPDIVATDGRSRVLAIETKSQTGKLTMDQVQWLSMLEHTGKVETYIWRPSDWPRILDILAERP